MTAMSSCWQGLTGAVDDSSVMLPSHWSALLAHTSDSTRVVMDALSSIRSALRGLVPHRPDLHERFDESVDFDIFEGLLRRGLCGAEEWIGLMRHVLGAIESLEAPVRNAETRLWMEDALSHIHSSSGSGSTSAATESAGGDGPSATSATSSEAMLTALFPRFMACVSTKLAQVRIDTVNVQLTVLGDYLRTNGRGEQYERERFESRMRTSDGHIDLIGARAWLNATLASYASVPSLGDAHVRFCALRDGVLDLLVCDMPLVDIAAASSRSERHSARIVTSSSSTDSGTSGAMPTFRDMPYPETLLADARALTYMQNEIQRIALVSTLHQVVQQAVVAQLRAFFASTESTAPRIDESLRATSVAFMLERLNELLSQSDLMFEGLARDVTGEAFHLLQILAPAAATPEAFEALQASLSVSLPAVVSAAHPVFSLMQKRIMELLRRLVTAKYAEGSSLPRGGGERFEAWRRALAPLSADEERQLASAPTPTGMPALQRLADQLTTLLDYNERIFRPMYLGMADST